MNDQTDQTDQTASTADSSDDKSYRVLARKYRPSGFDGLIGQESLVQTLTNALAMGRLAHAFVLTGLRGIGKTTTARIIARGLNCTGADGTGEPTLTPCGVCSSCVGIAEGRHVDVIEMDAASNTGVDDVREIIDGAGYRPLSARFKIYIIDEVHMLSKNAFNALLKTLEEPPAAVKFIFATTEIRKVPVTVLSRCQRFDLRRVNAPMMAEHLKSICTKENITIDDEALRRLVRAAEGSVRDALSLLDQAAAQGADKITDDEVAKMLGQAGRGQALEMLERALSGDAPAAIDQLDQAIGHGAAPQMVIADMLDLVHLASRLAAGGHLDDTPDAEADQLKTLAQECGVARLGRAWQILLKGHDEISMAPSPHSATDMLLIRLAHVATMPTPAELVQKLDKAPPPSSPSTGESAGASPSPVKTSSESGRESSPPPEKSNAEKRDSVGDDPEPALAVPVSIPKNIEELVKFCEDHGEMILASTLRMKITGGVFSDDSIALTANPSLPQDKAEEMAKTLSQVLKKEAGFMGKITFEHSTEQGQTLDDKDQAARTQELAEITSNPLVAATLKTFPGSAIGSIDAGDDLKKTRDPNHA